MFVLVAGYEPERAWLAKQERGRIPERARWASEESERMNMKVFKLHEEIYFN